MKNTALEAIMETKVIAIVRGIPSTQICDLAGAILAGGLRCLEVTFNHSSKGGIEETLRSIRLLSERFGNEIEVGAGTVMTAEEVNLAKEAGAGYIISPNADEAVIRETRRLELVSIPGAMTATEAACAWSWGANIVKLFPAGILGPEYIKALRGPLGHIPFTAVGGVTPQNTPDFLRAGCVGVGVGGNLVSAKLVSEGKLDEITNTARAYAQAVRG
ncbi:MULTISPECIES: bifunctional 4-hydroxy-2-oxoglutarate aldolase/2-dehydro-3-deoxy-phosphogluconate aldolase [unclassified Oscillibacter]|uniref:bifunctional 4-hydroxy-2-oxoglutarate aldolase/2-dehydro-3-deoxy-phosphogluconate aldolase n=1 Tax=unclassified Oscillibacter TaxID=2629304 RepID=UPI0025F7EAAE|nr:MULTISPECIES: bifunctional 4-hydroxy-2-oxoglutarate aldolase/2-dehydro-3-deoxy-phosphogluconate aldolase [unclassified Oscillibacter]